MRIRGMLRGRIIRGDVSISKLGCREDTKQVDDDLCMVRTHSDRGVVIF